MLDHPSSRVDLRSDTVTQPTKGMREAMAASVVPEPASLCLEAHFKKLSIPHVVATDHLLGVGKIRLDRCLWVPRMLYS